MGGVDALSSKRNHSLYINHSTSRLTMRSLLTNVYYWEQSPKTGVPIQWAGYDKVTKLYNITLLSILRRAQFCSLARWCGDEAIPFRGLGRCLHLRWVWSRCSLVFTLFTFTHFVGVGMVTRWGVCSVLGWWGVVRYFPMWVLCEHGYTL